MYLQNIQATNFRIFGDDVGSPRLDWDMNPGLNILIGENDAAKTGVMDCIRLALWTTSYETVRITESDFHKRGPNRSETLVIQATLKNLTRDVFPISRRFGRGDALVARSVAVHACGDDVRAAILATFTARHEVFRSALKPGLA